MYTTEEKFVLSLFISSGAFLFKINLTLTNDLRCAFNQASEADPAP